MIYHITTPIEWTLAEQGGHYSAPSLDGEGFIHCSTLEQVIPVANAFYKNESTIILLCIDESKLKSELKWEPPVHLQGHDAPTNSDEQLFPHVYGIINLDAVEKYVGIPEDDSGYHLPDGV